MTGIGDILGSLTSETRAEICEKHGDYTSKNFYKSMWSRCPLCDAEQRAEDKRKTDEEARIKALQAATLRWQAKLGAAAIPLRFQDRTLDTFMAETPEQERVLQFATDYAKDFSAILKTGRSAIFIGRPGTGKTHLAIGIGLHIMATQNRSVLFMTVQRAIRRVKDTWTKGSTASESQAIETLAYPDLLILDEVGVQSGSEFEKQILFDLLNDRYEKRKPTIILSNLEVKDVTAYLGERVADRLREDHGRVMVFNWDSYRGRK